MIKKFYRFLKLKYWDYKNPVKKRPYGIVCYVGRPGFGKTISMVEHLFRLKIEFPKCKIYTNFGFKYENGSINSQEDLVRLDNGEDGIIFALDELQNTFNSRNWNKFPPEMLSLITQNRKKSKQILCTAQSFSMIDKNFRQICNYIVECRNIAGRWIFQRAFFPEDYKEKDGEYRARSRAWRYSFIADNFIFNSYDTLKIIDGILSETEKKEEEKPKPVYFKIPVFDGDAGVAGGDVLT
jgi:ATP-dependent Clp protease ATP-binding subunit ClpX